MRTRNTIFPHWQYHWTRYLFEKIFGGYLLCRPYSPYLELSWKKQPVNYKAFWRKAPQFILPSIGAPFNRVFFRQSQVDEYFGKLIGSFQRFVNKELLLGQIFAWRPFICSGEQCHGTDFQLLHSRPAFSLPVQAASREVPDPYLVRWWLSCISWNLWWVRLLLQAWRPFSEVTSFGSPRTEH